MGVSSAIRDNLLAGLILVAPLVVTVFALRVLFGWISGAIDPIVEGTRLATYTANVQIAAQLLAIVAIVVLLILLGYIARWSVGERVFGEIGRLVNFLPLVRTIYSSTRQVANALVERQNKYESVVLVEYREGYSVIGFVTGETPAPIQDAFDEPTYTVFVPNSPNPTGGRLLLMPDSRVTEVDMSVRRGIRTLVTTGIASEDAHSQAPEDRDPEYPPSTL
jgi:uncharacterized membrane protein